MMSSIVIKSFDDADTQPLVNLFYNTVHTVNKKDYTHDQLEAWIPAGDKDLAAWTIRFKHANTRVAWKNKIRIGFGNLEKEGTAIGMLYVHKDWQGIGIGTVLLAALEKALVQRGIITAIAEVSLTARPFFERKGYYWTKDNRKMKNGIELPNFIMKKELDVKQKS